MPTGQEIIERVSIILNDEDHVRWTLPELCLWIKDAVKAIVLAKPSASTESRVLQLAAGTLQHLPTTGSPTPLMLVDIPRNLKTTAQSPRVGGRTIRPVKRSVIDVQEPRWHDTKYTRPAAEVRNFIYDEATPLEFYVYPPNDGAGIVEAVMSVLPAPLEPTGDVALVASYSGSIGLPEPYSIAVVDYVVAKALSKDDLGGDPGRAMLHFQAFASALGLKIQVEGATSPNARRP